MRSCVRVCVCVCVCVRYSDGIALYGTRAIARHVYHRTAATSAVAETRPRKVETLLFKRLYWSSQPVRLTRLREVLMSRRARRVLRSRC